MGDCKEAYSRGISEIFTRISKLEERNEEGSVPEATKKESKKEQPLKVKTKELPDVRS